MSGVLLLNFSERRWPEIQEALIGSLFVVASSISILLLTTNPHGGEQLKDLLAGQILWVNYQQLALVALLYAAILSLWFKFRKNPSSLLFYLLFALSITASVQLVGIYLVFASLILPALAIRHVKQSALLIGYLLSISAYALGLYIAAIADLPAGSVIVVCLSVLSLATALLLTGFKVKNTTT